jgi:hypothetical protein
MPAGANAADSMPNNQPFRFHTERRLVELTGRRASNLQELRALVAEVPGSSIFYHTHHLFLSHNFEIPAIYNQFAIWTLEALQEPALSEKLASIEIHSFTSIRDLRNEILRIIDAHLASANGAPRTAPEDNLFHFCQSRSFIFPTGVTAWTVPEFFGHFARISRVALYFHLLEARLRLERKTNDFSAWFDGLGEAGLARAIDSLDPYSSTLDELKGRILALGTNWRER